MISKPILLPQGVLDHVYSLRGVLMHIFAT